MFVYIFATDFIIHGIFLKDAYAATQSLWRTESEMQSMMTWMFLGQAIIAKYFTILFIKGYEGTGLMEGVRFGLYIGFFAVGGYCIQFAVSPLPISIFVAWLGLGLLQSVFGGILLSAIYPKVNGFS